jgi:hypothetical protein
VLLAQADLSCHAALSWSIALSVVIIFRMTATMMTLDFVSAPGEAIGEGLEGGIIPACAEGGPVNIMDRHSTPVNAAVSKRPTRAAICLRLILPSSGGRAMSVKASTVPTPGIEVNGS